MDNFITTTLAKLDTSLPYDDQLAWLTTQLTPFYDNDEDEAEYFAKTLLDAMDG